jgi:tetratricopeptide (TPR) repeat protein
LISKAINAFLTERLTMKKLFFVFYILLLMIACMSQRPERQEIRFINEEVAKAKNLNKLLILEFTAPECGVCLRLKEDIFENEESARFLADNFLVVSVSPSDPVYKLLWDHFTLENQSSAIILDQNGNEIDRTVSYNNNREEYIEFLKDVSQGKNLYSIVLAAYKKDTLNVRNNYLLAEKLMFRNQIKEAIKHYNNVLMYDPDNGSGLNRNCRLKIAESSLILATNSYSRNFTSK